MCGPTFNLCSAKFYLAGVVEMSEVIALPIYVLVFTGIGAGNLPGPLCRVVRAGRLTGRLPKLGHQYADPPIYRTIVHL